MTFSAHTLSIKLFTLHTHTFTVCCYVVISGLCKTGVMIIFMVFSWYLSFGGQCCVMRRHLWEDAQLYSYIRGGGDYVFICERKEQILDDTQWLICLFPHAGCCPVVTLLHVPAEKLFGKWHHFNINYDFTNTDFWHSHG